jgi:hypothetical protein
MYKIMGADQREYGPAASDGVREWIVQGRANGETLASFEGSPWKPLSTFPEFADALRSAAPPVFTTPPYAAGAMPKTNTIAVAGLVLSVLGMCCLPFSMAGLILSIVGLVQIQRNPALYTTTKIIPIIGIVLALLDFVFSAIAISSDTFQDMIRNLPR